MLKKSYKVNFISSLYELAQMVDASSSTGVNKAQLAATHDGRIIVPVYDWSTFLGQYFKKIKHHELSSLPIFRGRARNCLLQRIRIISGTTVCVT